MANQNNSWKSNKVKTKSTKVKFLICYNSTISENFHKPTCYSDANKQKGWRKAMDEEIEAILSNETWSLVPRRQDMNIIDSKWVYKIKRNSNGYLDRYKARLVLKIITKKKG